MKSSIEGEDLKSQYKNGFPLPKPDSFGICNNYDSAHFMKDDESECTQLVDLETECLNVLNAEFYQSKLQYWEGKGAASTTKKSVTIGKIYTYDDQTSNFPTIIEQPAGTAIISSLTGSGIGSDCTCSNYIREVHYDVTLVSTDFPEAGSDQKKYMKPTDIKANIVLDANPVTGKCGEKTSVKQKFSITFNSNAENTVYQKKSGNPGYLEGLPVKLANQQSEGSAMESYLDGFQLSGSDLQGNCFNAADAPDLFDFNDPVVKFRQDQSYGCSNMFNK